MNIFRKGNIVSRNSYGNDILFEIEDFIIVSGVKIAILNGITLRIKATSPLDDLRIAEKEKVKRELDEFDKRIDKQIFENRHISIACGKILHLDGDRTYAEKSARYYRKIGLNAIVRNIPESRQPFMVQRLLYKYRPDILVITGHDGMLKKGTSYYDLNNYKNSRYFIRTLNEARKVADDEQLIIFAGACQSFFEALMEAGANFASSPR